MSGRKYTGRSYNHTRSYMNDITDRHTQAMITKTRSPQKSERPADPAKVAERRKVLAKKGLLPALESEGGRCPVLLMGKLSGIAIGITREGFVIAEGWTDPFSPSAVELQKPPGT